MSLLVCCAALAQNTAPESPASETVEPLDEWISKSIAADRAEELDHLIDQLGSPSYAERVDATTVLSDAGPEAFAALRRAYAERKEDFEVRLRVEEIVREIYLQHHVYQRNGFLGISQVLIPKEHADDSRIPENHIAIEVNRVLPGTAAEAAELKKGDVIVALDGEHLSGDGRDGVMAFGESIRVRGPGARVMVAVLRGPKELEFEIVLGARPKMHYNVTQGPVFEMLDTALAGFDRFWEKHFAEHVADDE